MNHPSLPREQHVRSDSRTFRKRAQLNGQGTDGDLPIATMSTTSMAVNKQTQPRNVVQQQIIFRYCRKPGQNIICELLTIEILTSCDKRSKFSD